MSREFSPLGAVFDHYAARHLLAECSQEAGQGLGRSLRSSRYRHLVGAVERGAHFHGLADPFL